MTVFVKVYDKLSESFIASDPHIWIFSHKGVLCIEDQFTAFLKWDVSKCIDFMESAMVMPLQCNFVIRVQHDDICFSEDGLDDFLK